MENKETKSCVGPKTHFLSAYRLPTSYDVQHHITINEGINAIHELGFAPEEFQERFLELTARLPDTGPIADMVDSLPLHLLDHEIGDDSFVDRPGEVDRERKKQIRWYRERYCRLVEPDAKVRISAQRKELFWMLVIITCLAAPQLMARHSAWFKALRQRDAHLRLDRNRLYLLGHGRESRRGRGAGHR